MNFKSICFLLPGWITKNTGGSELQLFLLTEELVKKGWNVEVLTSTGSIKFPKYYNNKISYRYFRSSKIRLITFFSIFFNLLNSKSKYYYVRTNAPMLRGAVGLYCKLFRKKYIYALAGNDELKLTNIDMPLRKNLLKRIITFIDIHITNQFIRYQYSKVDLIICQTQEQFIIMDKNLKAKTVIISNSIKMRKNNITEKENIVLWVGNLRAVKRPEIFVQLAKDFLTSGYRFIMIGRINGYINIDNCNLPLSLELLGEQDFSTTSEWLARSKVIVNTSESEGFPNTFLEAWLYKTLVISLSFDSDNLIKKQRLGIFCNNNYVLLREHIYNIIRNDFDYSDIIDRANLLVDENYNIKKNVSKFIDYLWAL